MYRPHPDITTPPDETIVWRYMSIEKLLDLVTSQQITLASLDKFADPWEGHLPEADIQALTKSLSERISSFLSERVFDTLRHGRSGRKKTMYVNCWHRSEVESAALWSIYAGESGVAIKSSIGSLKKSISCPWEFHIGNVEYIDYEAKGASSGSTLSSITPAFLKRKSFSHEQEVRVFVEDIAYSAGASDERMDADECGYVKLDIDTLELVQMLHVSPNAPEWVENAIAATLEKFDIPRERITKSKLYTPR